MAGGRPKHFETPELLAEAVEEYLEFNKDSLTITGLAIALGFESRQSIYDYEKNGEYSYIIKKARLHVENRYERALMEGTPTGAIFALKNMGWADKIETDHTTKGDKINTPIIEWVNKSSD